MQKEMIINALVSQDVRVAILADGRLEAFFEEFVRDEPSRSNIYRGRVINIEPSLDACFVDYGASRHGFLPMAEIVRHSWAKRDHNRSQPRVDRVMRNGQLVTVQVEKEAMGSKGARLTTNLSLAGRYMVFMPYSDTRGVSRKIEDPQARRECRELASKLDLAKGTGAIIRTAGLGQSKRDLVRDLNYLMRLWKDIERKAKAATQPGLLHAEADLIQRVLRDHFTSDIERVWIDDRMALDKASKFFKLYMPRQRRLLKAYSDKLPIFSHFDVEVQIDQILSRRVELPSGGSLVIDQTEALVAIDVNSGKMKGQRNQEQTAYETNLEAAREIARQLRLRDLGGIVAIDFIDMTSASHKSAVERALREAMKAGKARYRIGKISAFGLCTLTRQRLGKPVRSVGRRECSTCSGSGWVADPEASAVRLLRRIRTEAATGRVEAIRLRLNLELANLLQNRHRAEILAVERDRGVAIEIAGTAEIAGSEEQVEIVPRAQEPETTEAAGAAKPVKEAPADKPRTKRRRRRKRKTAEALSDADGHAAFDTVKSVEGQQPDATAAVESAKPDQQPVAQPSAVREESALDGRTTSPERKKRRRRRRRKKGESPPQGAEPI